MSNERLGIVEQRGLDRERYGRFAYRAPVPGLAKVHTIDVDLRKETKAITSGPPPIPPKPPKVRAQPESITDLRIRVARLTKTIAAKDQLIAELSEQITPKRKCVPIADVMAKFCEIARDEGYRVGSREYTFDELIARRRSQTTSWPRHVCIDLVHRLSGASTSIIGRAFGGIDHTSVLHALHRSAEHKTVWPVLATIHAKVLAAFEAPQQ